MVTPKYEEARDRRVKASPRSGPLTDWTFNVDRAEERRAGAQYLMTVLITGNRADTFEARVAQFVEEVNRDKEDPDRLIQPRIKVSRDLSRDRGGRPPREGEVSLFAVVADEALITALDTAAELETEAAALLDGIFILGHGLELPDDAVGEETERPAPMLPDAPPKKGMVITAVIDTGIPFLNAAFLDGPSSTRVRYAWVQDGRRRPPPQQFVPHGREFDKAQIDALLAAGIAGQPVRDELALYRDEGLADFTRRKGRHALHPLGYRSTHGGFVAPAAAGYPMDEADSDQAIIFVQLPRIAVADASGQSMEPYLIAAIDYIFDRADRIAMEEGCGQLPLVINFSFGGTGGPLDGTSSIETFLDQQIDDRNKTAPGKTALVLPAGNAYLSRCHAKVEAGKDFEGPGKTEVLTWQIQPDDHTASFAEVWTPRRNDPTQGVLEVGLTRPYDTTAPVFLPEVPNTAVDLLENGDVIGRVVYEWVGPPTNRGKFTVIVQATAKPGFTGELAPSGPWKITLKDVGLTDGQHVDAWVLRDDELPRFDTDARQSYFTSPNYRRWTHEGYPEERDVPPDCVIKRAGLQNVLGTGREPVVIGGYVEKSGKAAIYTAGGPTNTSDRPGPDAMAVSDDSVVHWGVLSGLVLSGGESPANGTSMSAPAIAKMLARELSADPAFLANRASVHAIAVASEAANFPPGSQPPVERSGHGRIQLAPPNNRRYQP